MLTCTKLYTDVPFAHRQHRHAGHCKLVHGHNWDFRITFACSEPDANGFVVDFGDLKFLKQWIQDHLDHACLLNEDDPQREALVSGLPEAWKLYVLPNCSCEGIARHLHSVWDPLVRAHTSNRAWILAIEVVEDSKNSATYRAEG